MFTLSSHFPSRFELLKSNFMLHINYKVMRVTIFMRQYIAITSLTHY